MSTVENPMKNVIDIPNSEVKLKSAKTFNYEKTEKFIDDYLTFTRKVSEGFFSRLLGSIPIIGHLFKWNIVKTRRNSGSEQTIMKPGFFTKNGLLDGLSLRWIGYLDAAPPDADDFDLIPEYQNEFTNIGLLSALVLQIVPNFILLDTPEFEEGSSVVLAYEIFCFGAFMCFLACTAICVLFLLILGLTGNNKEANHFMNIFKEHTYGIGPHAPLVCLYLGALNLVGFITIFTYLNYNRDGFIGCLSQFVFIVIVFLYFCVEGVACLYTARVSQAIIQNGHVSSLTIKDVKRYPKDLIQERKGIEKIESLNDLKSFIRSKVLQELTAAGTISSPYPICQLSDTCISIIEEVFHQELKRQIKESW